MKKVLQLHPILFAIFPALSVVADHLEFVSLNQTVLLITLTILGLAAFVFLVLNRIWKNSEKAALFTSLALILFFSYGHAFDYLTKVQELTFIQHRHLFLVWASAFVLLFIFVWRTKQTLANFNKWLTAVGLSLILFSALSIIQYREQTKNSWQPELAIEPDQSAISATQPDIYYIILDAYANQATLDAFYDYDNRPFLDGLEAKGFYIASESRSNYALTSLSLSSSLNLNYVNEIANQTREMGVSLAIPRRIIENNHVMNFLREQGYQIVFLGSGYGVSQSNQLADVDVRCGRVDETVGRFIATSMLRAPADRFRLVEQDDRQRRLCMFARLANMPESNQPKFVFAHVPSPHWPFLFDANGNPVSLENLSHAELKAGYLEQLTYLNGRVNQIIDAILQNSMEEPIIIIQSDHGPSFEVGMDNPSQALYRERMRILNLYYMPPEAQAMLYPSITPVNSFRVVFNYLHATQLPLLEDQSYFSTYENPYHFTNVTESILSN